MRAVIQRVASASVLADGEIVSSIGRGLCVLIGISRDDTREDMDYIVRKILSLRLFSSDDEDHYDHRWSHNVMEKGFEVLCLSQITLYQTLKGNKLDFRHAMQPELSKEFYRDFLTEIRKRYKSELIKEGIFGKKVLVNIQNDGPLTVNLESPFSIQKAQQIKKEKAVTQKEQQLQQQNDQQMQLEQNHC